MDGAWLFRGLPEAAVMPRRCACCGAEPARGMRERRPLSTFAVLVPYCAECHRHASIESTRVLAVSVATALASVTLTVGLPLVLTEQSLFAYAALVVIGSVAPPIVSWLRRRAAPDGHLAAGRAAHFRLDGAFVCRSLDFANELAASSGAAVASGRTSGLAVAPWALAVVGASVLSVWPAFRFHFPVVRVVNTTGDPLTVAIDGRDRGRVPSTERESELAGIELRVAAGDRVLRAFDPAGRLVDQQTVSVEAGAVHLYAPSSGKACFRVETTGFGRSSAAGTTAEPLVGPPYFWVLPPAGIDYWFSPAPPPADDSRSTGRLVRALRQLPCAETR